MTLNRSDPVWNSYINKELSSGQFQIIFQSQNQELNAVILQHHKCTDLRIRVLLGVGAPDWVHSSSIGVGWGGVWRDSPCVGRAGHFERSAWSIAWVGGRHFKLALLITKCAVTFRPWLWMKKYCILVVTNCGFIRKGLKTLWPTYNLKRCWNLCSSTEWWNPIRVNDKTDFSVASFRKRLFLLFESHFDVLSYDMLPTIFL